MRSALSRALRQWAEKDGRGYPDWALRYAPALRGLARVPLDRARILEIGANEAGFARFAGVRAIVTDIAPDHLRAARAAQDVWPVAADAAALPFAEGSIDLCVCLDTFEHLDESLRRAAVRAIAHVLSPRGAALVGFPTGEASARAERSIAQAYLAYSGNRLRWLEEHAACGLPDPERVASDFTACLGATHTVRIRKNANLAVWTWMWKVLLCGWPGRGNALAQAALRALTPLLSRMHAGACYRAMVWVEPKED